MSLNECQNRQDHTIDERTFEELITFRSSLVSHFDIDWALHPLILIEPLRRHLPRLPSRNCQDLYRSPRLRVERLWLPKICVKI